MSKQRNTALSSGTVEMGARLYQPQIGRFLQPDPIFGGSLNPYDYVSQDPIQTDLSGLQGAGGHCFKGTPQFRPKQCKAAGITPIGQPDPYNKQRTTPQGRRKTAGVFALFIPGGRVATIAGKALGAGLLGAGC